MTNKILAYAIINIISIFMLTLIPYLFISYINWEWQNLSKWTDDGKAMFAFTQAALYIPLIFINLATSIHYDK